MQRLLNQVENHKGESGFTLIELLVVMALLGMAMTTIYSAYFSQQKSFMAQTQLAAAQQNVRAAMHMMVTDMRMAGYDKENAGTFGLVSELPGFTASGATCNATGIAFTLDADEDRNQDSNDDELIAYRLVGTDLLKFTTGASNSGLANWNVIARDIQALDFVYLDGNGAETATLANVRSIEVSVLARTARPDPDYVDNNTYTNQRNEGLIDPGNAAATPGDGFRRRLLTSFVKCRNLGI